MTFSSIILSIWGIPLQFHLQTEQVLLRLYDEFSGSIVPASSVPKHQFVYLCGEPSVPTQGEVRIRHRGGSSGDKRYANGKIFKAELQNRDAGVLSEGPNCGIYSLDGCSVVSGAADTVIFGPADRPYVLADLVEAYLLDVARASGWVQCHGAGWLRADGKVSVAVGPSGAGKTTRLLSSIGKGSKFLGNDRIFFRMLDGELQARGYPLAMNVGCGTIRGLQLDIPHFDGADHDKIRLTPSDVEKMFPVDYDTWFPVAEILAPDASALLDNLYFTPDPSHPGWNCMWRSELSSTFRNTLAEAALSPQIFTASALKDANVTIQL